jgi:curved DNA-binding protein CbpA
MPGKRDAYEILQIHPSALPEVVEAAYRVLAMLHHPDRNGSPDGSAMAELNWAYATLRDPEQRIAYDRDRVAISIGAPARSTLLRRMEQTMNAAVDRDTASPARMVLDFGRYEGLSLGQVARTDPAYLEWLKRHSSGLRYRHAIDEVMAAIAGRRPMASAASGE